MLPRLSENGERLVRATLKREELRNAVGQIHERSPSGIAGAVPTSLVRTSNIDAILQAADEIQDEDPNVARILCEQAHSMAQDLDPNSDGRGVLQFKTGLISVIEQKLAKKDGARIDRNQDIEHLWEFYQRYKRRYRVDDIQREEQKWRESGTSSSANLGEFELRSLEMKKVFSTLRALVEVMEALSKDADPHGVGRHIMEEMMEDYSEPVSEEREIVQANSFPRKPRILLAASGSVAAIKFGNLCHCFSEWAEVRAVATRASLHFIDRASLPKDVVLYTDEDEWSSWNKIGDSVLHIELRRWADIMVIAPLSANTLGKIAGGLCDNLLTCIVRAWDYSKPLFVAPAMNTFMWSNPFTERHLMSIDELGISLIPPVSKRLACGDYGNGAMAEPSLIYSTVRLFMDSRTQPGDRRVG